ncbi:MAG: mycothiol system anti-sigma-R factor [Actinomycetota bacterium]
MADDTAPLNPQCEDALHEIYHLLAGELVEVLRDQIAQHLDQCSPCAEPYDFYAELRRTLQQRCRDTAPASLLARIEEAIQHEPH